MSIKGIVDLYSVDYKTAALMKHHAKFMVATYVEESKSVKKSDDGGCVPDYPKMNNYDNRNGN